MDVDEAPQVTLPDLALADRRFLLDLPETTNKAQLLKEIKEVILKDSMFGRMIPIVRTMSNQQD